jgi:outer membrane protein W
VSGSNATLGTFSEEDEIKVIPVVVSAKGIYPTGNFELFGEFGVGAFFADFEGTLITSALGTTVIDDSDTVFGIILGVGAIYNITRNAFFGIEVKYLATDDVEIKGAIMGVPVTLGGDLNGIIATANLGFRF